MKVLVTGGYGFLGKYVVEKLYALQYADIKIVRSKDTDLRDKISTEKLFLEYQPDFVIHLAASVGGIGANMKKPGEFFYDNMSMGLNVIEASRLCNSKKLIQIGTVCSYPKYTPVPFQEKDLWDGFPEETNAPYGIAKKALYVMLEAYKKQYNFNSTVLVPCNLYGPYDNFNPDSSHVIPAIIKKMVYAVENGEQTVVCWGSGDATREFLYVENVADAIVKSIQVDTGTDPINLGSGSEISIKQLTELIAGLVGFEGVIEWDSSKPDGQPRRCLDTTMAQKLLNWQATTPLKVGLKNTVDWYRSNKN